MTIGILINVIFFFGMGISALISPKSVISFVSLVPTTVDARNEVRAVYGGFGIAISLLLVFATFSADIRSGVLVSVAVSLIGMALGRVISILIEKPGIWPVIFIFMESFLAGLLLWSL